MVAAGPIVLTCPLYHVMGDAIFVFTLTGMCLLAALLAFALRHYALHRGLRARPTAGESGQGPVPARASPGA